MRWRRVSTREKGWRRDVLEHGGCLVGSVDTFSYASYGNVLGERVGAIRGRRKAKRVVQRLARDSNSGLMRFAAILEST